jgi:hypothetical protein
VGAILGSIQKQPANLPLNRIKGKLHGEEYQQQKQQGFRSEQAGPEGADQSL